MLAGDQLRQRVAEHRWYHTLDLGQGVVTPGWFDTRGAPDAVGLPRRLDGRRCLDIGTFDGFWAFEMERRGATEVVAVDVLDPERWDWPAGTERTVVEEMATMKAGGAGFALASEALDSRVRRLDRNVYDLDADDIGTFDFVYVGSLLLHLRDPVRALERVRAVTGGEVLVVDAIDLELSLLLPRRAVAGFDGIGRPWWWKPNAAGLRRMVESAGFTVVDGPRRVYLQPGPGQVVGRPSARSLLSRGGREALVTARRGDPHACIRARP